MANDIFQFQEGREAAIAGKPLDKRRSKDWQEGWRQVMADANNACIGVIVTP